MNQETVEIRNLHPDEISDAMGLVFAEGWNQTETDWTLLIRNRLNVCLAAKLDGKLVGTATAINYKNQVAWIGMVLVNREYRGLGISKKLLSAIFEQLKSCKSIKLDATPAGLPVYQKLNFKAEYLISRMIHPAFPRLADRNNKPIPEKLKAEDISEIIEFDKKAFGADRSQLINALVGNFPDMCFVLKRDNLICGFALGRVGNKHHQIGPIMAKSKADAKLLAEFAFMNAEGKSIVVDVLNDKSELAQWLESIGFVTQRQFTRMFLGENVFPGTIENQYLISGPEFG